MSIASGVQHDEGRSRRPRRVCHLVYSFYETDNRVVRYAKALLDRGDEVDVIALRREGQTSADVVDGVHVTRVQRRSKTERSPLVFLLKLLWFAVQASVVLTVRHVRRPYDVIHVHNVPDFLVVSALVPWVFGVRVILDIHDILPELYAGKFGTGRGAWVFRALLAVERLSCRMADHVIVANHLWSDRIARRAQLRGKVTTILNYPDLRLFQPSETPRPRLRPFTMLYPGSLSKHQGLEVALRAFAKARPEIGDTEFHIYGEGPNKAGLRALATDLGLNDHVVFHDPVAVDRIPSIMASADLGVEPKLATEFSGDALSTKILEFMAAGVPVVVSRTAAHAHYFSEDVVRFFEAGAEDALAAAMLEAYRDGAATERATRAQVFAGTFAWALRMHEYFEVVDNRSSAYGIVPQPVA